MSNDSTTDALKLKVKSAAKLKLMREKDLCKIRDRERSINEELVMVQIENQFLAEQLEDMKNHIVQAKHQISMIEICSTSEKVKIESHIRNMESHQKGFQDIFDQERNLHELRIKELHEIETLEKEHFQQKEKMLADRNEQKCKEADAIEAECDAIEKECAVLKKRNNAIMLKLRRRLFETANARRELLKRNADPDEKAK